ncbi:hypothetical protein HY745_08105 [Candidatus Desantisbacteria bacterium]|nr:hypothetical protein [Candidatus Desantisbacteria bacterium]
MFSSACTSNPSNEKLEPAFSSISKYFFSKKCTFYTCHSDVFSKKSGHLDLSPQNAYKDLVNKKSRLYPERFRVKPGEPENSVLMHRLEGSLICGPTVERSKINKKEIDIVRQWIKEGAKNN